VQKEMQVDRSKAFAKRRLNELNAKKGKSVWEAIADGDLGD
jgi:hypothetical protein